MKTTSRHPITPVGLAAVRADRSDAAEGWEPPDLVGAAPLGRFGSFSEVNLHQPEDQQSSCSFSTQGRRTRTSLRPVHELELFTAALFVNGQNMRTPCLACGEGQVHGWKP